MRKGLAAIIGAAGVGIGTRNFFRSRWFARHAPVYRTQFRRDFLWGVSPEHWGVETAHEEPETTPDPA
jgi:hypothetical protein